MGSHCPLIYVCLLMAFLVSTIFRAQAQNTPEGYVAAHNEARAQIGVDPMTWDANVTGYAVAYANRIREQCLLEHSGGPYGENLAMGSGDLTGVDAVVLWVNERRFYNYESNSCESGQVCGHHTQVVWRTSLRLGCALVSCDNGNWFVICNYDPPGNIAGERPY